MPGAVPEDALRDVAERILVALVVQRLSVDSF